MRKSRSENSIIYELYFGNEYLGTGTIPDLARELKLNRRTLVNYKRRDPRYKFIDVDKLDYISYKKIKEYACYEDDTFITIGTLTEIANYLGITYGTLLTYKSKKLKYIFVEV